jgi:hypothetical protein
MSDHRVDEKKLAAKVIKAGVKKASPDYIADVVSGYYPPSRKLGKALAKVSGVEFGQIMAYPYRAKRAA